MSPQTMAPKLEVLKSRKCTPEELQAALIQLIEHHNGLVADINRMLKSGQIRSAAESWRASL